MQSNWFWIQPLYLIHCQPYHCSNSVEHTPLECMRCSFNPEIPNFLKNPEVHYLVHRDLSHVCLVIGTALIQFLRNHMSSLCLSTVPWKNLGAVRLGCTHCSSFGWFLTRDWFASGGFVSHGNRTGTVSGTTVLCRICACDWPRRCHYLVTESFRVYISLSLWRCCDSAVKQTVWAPSVYLPGVTLWAGVWDTGSGILSDLISSPQYKHSIFLFFIFPVFSHIICWGCSSVSVYFVIAIFRMIEAEG